MSILSNYEDATNRLLINPVPSPPLYQTSDLDIYINEGRQQLAGEAECIRASSIATLTMNIQSYSFSLFSSFLSGGSSLAGIQGALTIRQMAVASGGGFQLLAARSYGWFFESYIGTGSAAATGIPEEWAQVGRGASGTFAVSPIPTSGLSIIADVTCIPTPLTSGSGVEPIPYPFTDAIPFYAAYKAKLSSQQYQGAEGYFRQYKEYVRRAVEISTSTILPGSFLGGLGAQIAAAKVPLSEQGGGQR